MHAAWDYCERNLNFLIDLYNYGNRKETNGQKSQYIPFPC